LSKAEEERIKKVYEDRKRKGKLKELYSFFNPSYLFDTHQREKKLLSLLKKHGFDSFEKRKVLDVGCGTGGVLRRFLDYGAEPENLYGIDLLPDRIEVAKKLAPHVNFHVGNAVQLPFESDFFDIVVQFTVFTSILDSDVKRKVAEEMIRVLKPDGIIIWYDYWISKPTNPDVKGVGKKEICRLFPECTFDFNKITLAPPLTRFIAQWSYLLCYLLENLKFLNTHYLVAIRK